MKQTVFCKHGCGCVVELLVRLGVERVVSKVGRRRVVCKVTLCYCSNDACFKCFPVFCYFRKLVNDYTVQQPTSANATEQPMQRDETDKHTGAQTDKNFSSCEK